jgi:hypothetical protein
MRSWLALGFLATLGFSPVAEARSRNLTTDSLVAVAQAQSRSLISCYERSGEARLPKSHVELEVQPGGAVSDVSIQGALPPEVAECVEARMRTWHFPRFAGAARRLSYSLVFVASR